jgi:hypothetical protein
LSGTNALAYFFAKVSKDKKKTFYDNWSQVCIKNCKKIKHYIDQKNLHTSPQTEARKEFENSDKNLSEKTDVAPVSDKAEESVKAKESDKAKESGKAKVPML